MGSGTQVPNKINIHRVSRSKPTVSQIEVPRASTRIREKSKALNEDNTMDIDESGEDEEQETTSNNPNTVDME